MKKQLSIFGQQISIARIAAIVAIALFAVVSATTIGEFAVSVHNRYSVYPVGTDTNMYGNSAIGQGLVCLLAATAIAYLLRKQVDIGTIVVAFVLCIVLLVLSAQVASFVPADWCRYELTMYPCNMGNNF